MGGDRPAGGGCIGASSKERQDRSTAITKKDWEPIGDGPGYGVTIYRLKVPGGWLIGTGAHDAGVTFYPDPPHEWDGRPLA